MIQSKKLHPSSMGWIIICKACNAFITCSDHYLALKGIISSISPTESDFAATSTVVDSSKYSYPEDPQSLGCPSIFRRYSHAYFNGWQPLFFRQAAQQWDASTTASGEVKEMNIICSYMREQLLCQKCKASIGELQLRVGQSEEEPVFKAIIDRRRVGIMECNLNKDISQEDPFKIIREVAQMVVSEDLV